MNKILVTSFLSKHFYHIVVSALINLQGRSHWGGQGGYGPTTSISGPNKV